MVHKLNYRPTHDLVVYAECGCPISAIADFNDEGTQRMVANALRDGGKEVHRVKRDTERFHAIMEAMKHPCIHIPVQLPLPLPADEEQSLANSPVCVYNPISP